MADSRENPVSRMRVANSPHVDAPSIPAVSGTLAHTSSYLGSLASKTRQYENLESHTNVRHDPSTVVSRANANRTSITARAKSARLASSTDSLVGGKAISTIAPFAL